MNSLFAALRRFFLLALAAALVGCAAPSPRYQSAYRYEPPTDSAGRACLEKCGQKLEGCRQRCTADYKACLVRIEPLVEGRYNEALKRYEAELDRYRLELDRYQLYLSLSWHDSFWYGPGFFHPWPGPYYFPPVAPRRPSRDEAFSRLRQEQCQEDCSCQPLYDACFLTCGGKRIVEERCVANCPEGR